MKFTDIASQENNEQEKQENSELEGETSGQT